MVGDAVGNDLNGEVLGVADRFITCLPVTHHARKLQCLGDPAPVFLPIQINRQVLGLRRAISSRARSGTNLTAGDGTVVWIAVSWRVIRSDPSAACIPLVRSAVWVKKPAKSAGAKS